MDRQGELWVWSEHALAAAGCEGAKHGVFSCTQQMGPKNAKHVESESVREQKMKCWW